MHSPELSDVIDEALAGRVVPVPGADTAAPIGVLVTVLAAELAVVTAVIASSAARVTIATADLGTAAYLAALGIAATAIAVRRTTRRGPTSPPGIDLSPAWTFPATLLLHPALTAALVVVLHSHHARHTPRNGVALRRRVVGVAAAVLSCLAAPAAYAAAGEHLDSTTAPTPWSHTGAVVIAVAGFAGTHRGVLAATGVTAAGALDPTGWDGNRLAVATSSLGGLTAAALALHPLLMPFVLPAACCLHRATLARHLEHAGRVDAKTGLLTAPAWHTHAQRALHHRDPRLAPSGVLVIDLDHFKTVNDTHGHLAGDTVLVAIADALRAEVRDRDLVGRFGGDEFAVLLTRQHRHPDRHDPAGLRAVAERICSRVAALQIEAPTPHGTVTITGLSVSIGGAPIPDDQPDLQGLFHLADTALYDPAG